MKYFAYSFIIVTLSFVGCEADSEQENQKSMRLDSNDVSILFPLPKSSEERDALISIEELKSSDGQPVFPRSDFDNMLEISAGDAGKVGQNQITFPAAVQQDFSNWKIAAFRFDPIAVGGSSAVSEIFGHSPQIRLTLQPVTERNGRVTVHDITLHLIYSFTESRVNTGNPALVGKATPDTEAVANITRDLHAIKDLCAQHGVSTDTLFSVHPGFRQNVPGFTEKIKQFLETHLKNSRLNSGAIMGLHGGRNEPWIFIAMLRSPDSGEFIPFPSVGVSPIQEQIMGHMITFLEKSRIQPVPQTFNRMPATNNLAIPRSMRRGVSTEPLFDPTLDQQAFAKVGVDDVGNVILDTELKNADIPDFIANPEHSHFFNTDCASCHTETTRREILKFPESKFAYKYPEDVSKLDLDMIPKNRWNVRNFGWFESKETITQRTANETAEVVEFINRLTQESANTDGE